MCSAGYTATSDRSLTSDGLKRNNMNLNYWHDIEIKTSRLCIKKSKLLERSILIAIDVD